jgi:uncharacterized phage protein gp47/JayE
MQLSLQNFTTLVENMAAAVQGAASDLLDLTVGSVLRAILEANASLALWLQWLIAQVLASTRLATSTGSDCDSFGADFGFIRLSAVAAVGDVTFSRFTPNIAAFIPVGTSVATSDNTQTFLVTSDGSNPAFNGSGFTLASGLSNITVPVAALIAGNAGNVQTGTISVLTAAIPGVDTVKNGLPIAGGLDAESDPAFKIRFESYLASLSKATDVAIGAAITGLQQGLNYQISENVDQTGAQQMGHFVVTVDNGTGEPPTWLLSEVYQVVDAVRPVGSSFAVQGPVVVLANVSMTITTNASASHEETVASVAGAIEAYIASLSIGATLNYTRLVQVAYGAAASVLNVSDLTLNGGSTDLSPQVFAVVRSGTIAVS